MNYPGNDVNLGSICGDGRQLLLSRQDRARHVFTVGSTRTGKSKLLEDMGRQDLRLWPNYRCPMVVFDPHGPLHDGLMNYVAAEGFHRWPVIPLDLRRDDAVVSYDWLRKRTGIELAVLVRGFVRGILHAWNQSNTTDTPRLAAWLETLLSLAYERECSLVDALRALRDPHIRRAVTREVEHIVARNMLESQGRLPESEFQDKFESTMLRVNRFVSNAVVRAMVCAGGRSFDLAQVLEQGGILLACLSTEGGRIDQEDADTIGSVLLSDLWMTARRRGKREEGALRPCYVYIDEFYQFVGPAIAESLAQASGFGLHLTFAAQYPSQTTDKDPIVGRMILNSVLANAKTKIVFQIEHPGDLEMLAAVMGRQHIDPRAVKHELWTTKVMQYDLQYLPSFGQSVSNEEGGSHLQGSAEAVSDVTTDMTGGAHSVGVSRTTGSVDAAMTSAGSAVSVLEARADEGGAWMAPGQTSVASEGHADSHADVDLTSLSVVDTSMWSRAVAHGLQRSINEARTSSWAAGRSESTQYSPVFAPVMGKELSAVQFWPIQEQLHLIAQYIDAQPDRHCLVRMASSRLAVPLLTNTVRPALATEQLTESFRTKLLGRLDFILSMSDAQAAVQQRGRKFLEGLSSRRTSADEPVSAKRVVRRASPAATIMLLLLAILFSIPTAPAAASDTADFGLPPGPGWERVGNGYWNYRALSYGPMYYEDRDSSTKPKGPGWRRVGQGWEWRATWDWEEAQNAPRIEKGDSVSSGIAALSSILFLIIGALGASTYYRRHYERRKVELETASRAELARVKSLELAAAQKENHVAKVEREFAQREQQMRADSEQLDCQRAENEQLQRQVAQAISTAESVLSTFPTGAGGVALSKYLREHHLRGILIGDILTVTYMGDPDGFVRFKWFAQWNHPMAPSLQVWRNGNLVRQESAFANELSDHLVAGHRYEYVFKLLDERGREIGRNRVLELKVPLARSWAMPEQPPGPEERRRQVKERFEGFIDLLQAIEQTKHAAQERIRKSGWPRDVQETFWMKIDAAAAQLRNEMAL